MTSLSPNRLVPKTHGRIVFRGIIDSLEAEVIEAQVLAGQLGEEETCGRLGEILDYLRSLMAAEVKETPLPPPVLFGMDAGEIQRRSHNAGDGLLLPSYTQGALAARLNTLRAKTREAEIWAIRVFGPEGEQEGGCLQEPGQVVVMPSPEPALRDVLPAGAWAGGCDAQRQDIQFALNRLSSALWWLFCEQLLIRQRDKSQDDLRLGQDVKAHNQNRT